MGNSRMPDAVGEIASRHSLVCERFGRAVLDAQDRWDLPSPSTDWDASGVVEHVIGFHDVLLLRPMGAKPERPRGDPTVRWAITWDALRSLLNTPGLFDGAVAVPAVGNNPPTRIEAAPLVSLLTQDVLVHTWDLARAVGADDRLDPDLCAFYLSRLPDDSTSQVQSGMFASPVQPAEGANPQSALLARLGRDPGWRSPGPAKH